MQLADNLMSFSRTSLYQDCWVSRRPTVTTSCSPFPKQALIFMCLPYKSFGNTKEKGEIASNEQFLLFQVFSNIWKNFMPFSSNLKLSSANLSLSVWKSVKFVVWEIVNSIYFVLQKLENCEKRTLYTHFKHSLLFWLCFHDLSTCSVGITQDCVLKW